MRLWAVLIWDLLEDNLEPPTWMNTQADHIQFSHSTLVRLWTLCFHECAHCHSFHMQLLTVLCSILPHIQPSFHGKWPCLQFFFSMWVTITSEQGINHYMYALFATVSCILSECIVFSCVLIGHFWIIRIYPFLWDWGECLTTTTTLYFVSKSQRTIFQTLTTGS